MNHFNVFNCAIFAFNYRKNCDSPTYMEAREVESLYDWLGSSNKLAYPINSSDTDTTWAWGISTVVGYDWYDMNHIVWNKLYKVKFSFACLNNFQNTFKCKDFEARFCCPRSVSQRQRQDSVENDSGKTSTEITEFKITSEPRKIWINMIFILNKRSEPWIST